MNFLKNTKIVRVMNGVVAGTSVQTSSVVDMAGFEGVVFVASLGALTAGQVTSLKAQGGALANGSDAVDLAGTLTGPLVDADGNKVLALEIARPQTRYVRCVVNRATANAVIDGVNAFLYGAKVPPTTQDATTVAANKVAVSPAAGTA